MRVIKLVEVGLKANDFDGLFYSGVCACKIGDISPADCITSECEAGYIKRHSQDSEKWVISSDEGTMADEEILNIIENCS